MTPDIPEMQREHEDRLRATTRWIIAETDDGFEVHEFTACGVAPWAVKATREEAAARLLQLIGIRHAIIPQDYPERVCVGAITIEDETPCPSPAASPFSLRSGMPGAGIRHGRATCARGGADDRGGGARLIFAHIRIAGCWVWRWLSRMAYAALPHIALGAIVVTCAGVPAWIMARPAPIWDGGAPVERGQPVDVP